LQRGGTCLMYASSQGHMEVVKYLCEVGGKELLMTMENVSVRMHLWMHS
jgi:hypothetical protein